MERGLYIAASGMLAEQVRQAQIANDLANASTPGYKADRTSQRSFNDLLLASGATGGVVGRASTSVQVAAIETDFRPAAIRETGEPLDFAIQGEGFFAVRTDRGVRYTRNGQFAVSPQGLLATPQGDPVLGPGGATVRIPANGRVEAGAVGVVVLQDARKEGDSLVTGTPAAAARRGQVRAGALEASGADATRAMVDMIASMRSFEAGQRVITTIDSTLDRAANRVGTLG